MDAISIFLQNLKDSLSYPLFKLGETNITVWILLTAVVYILGLFYITSKIKKWTINSFLASRNIQLGVRQAIGSILRYTLVIIGLFLIFQNLGIDLSSLMVLAGALGVGLGFGLQNIINNWLSGLIILFERPIKVGDRIKVGDVSGNVERIAIRATVVRTNENISVIVPNSEFISSNVVNLSYNDTNVRFKFPIGVAYGSDVELVRKVLLEVAEAEEGVLKEPKPDVLFDEYAESSLNFFLRVWTTDFLTRPGVLRSRINFAIDKKFRENNINIPFPTRTIHIESLPAKTKLDSFDSDNHVEKED